jgi:arylsulfatase
LRINKSNATRKYRWHQLSSYLIKLFSTTEKHPFLYWEFPGYGGQQAVRLGKWKGIIQDMNKGNTTIQLFDLDKDMQEQHDVAEQNPEVVKKIERIMKEQHRTPEVASFRMKVLDGE